MNNQRLELALSALVIWCKHLLMSGDLSARQEAILQKLLRDVEQAKELK